MAFVVFTVQDTDNGTFQKDVIIPRERVIPLTPLYLRSLEWPSVRAAALAGPSGSRCCHKGHRWEARTAAFTRPGQTSTWLQ